MYDLKNLIPFTGTKSILTLIFLVILGLAGNYFSLSILFGVDFIFSSIALLIIVHLYGVCWGALASLVVNSYTYVLWHHPYGIIIFTLEILFIGLFMKGKSKNITLLDGIYWLVIGMPMVWIFYYVFIGMDTTQTLLIMLKDTMNGIMNTVFASLIINCLPLRKWAFNLEDDKHIPIAQMFFDIIAGCVLATSLLISVFQGYDKFNHIMDDVKTYLEDEAEEITADVLMWRGQYFRAIDTVAQQAARLGMGSPKELQEHISLVKQPFPDFHTLYIADASGTTIAFEPMVNDNGESTIGLNFSDRDYFREVATKLKPAISDVFIGRGGVTGPITTISIPIINDNKFQGFVSGALDLEYISSILKASSSKEGYTVVITDNKNRVFASTDPNIEIMTDFYLDQRGGLQVLDDTVFHWIPKTKDLSEMERWNESSLVKIQSIEDNIPWTFVIRIPIASYLEELEVYYIRSFIVMLVVMIISVTIATIFGGTITNPILKLADVTTDLPAIVSDSQPLSLPKGDVSEVGLLTNNIKLALNILKDNFSEIQNTKKRLEYLVHHDPLTNLPNRMLFKKHLDDVISKPDNISELVAVMYMDLDRFKIINDTMGHNFGDEVLKKLGGRLISLTDHSTMVCRMGGDEFVLLISGVENIHNVTNIAFKILEGFKAPFVVENNEFYITASIGIAFYPDDGTDSEVLIKKADMAMYHAKQLGKNNYQFYNAFMDAVSMKNLKIENLLRRALELNEFVLHYQPQYDINTDKIIGMEALIRWNNHELGLVSPKEFIPIAEETGMITSIGEWVLHMACAQNKAWQNAGLAPVRVSVNISGIQFQQHNLVEKVTQILKETKLEPQWLELEITESTIIKDVGHTIHMVRDLTDMGIRVAIDDFGTGFSSLNYLKNFKIDSLKIDASFVRDIIVNCDDAAIVETIIMLGKNLKLKVVAEGVETDEQFKFLKEHGCDQIQGYFISKPMPPEACKELLNRC